MLEKFYILGSRFDPDDSFLGTDYAPIFFIGLACLFIGLAKDISILSKIGCFIAIYLPIVLIAIGRDSAAGWITAGVITLIGMKIIFHDSGSGDLNSASEPITNEEASSVSQKSVDDYTNRAQGDEMSEVEDQEGIIVRCDYCMHKNTISGYDAYTQEDWPRCRNCGGRL
jgi:hypothetical protein